MSEGVGKLRSVEPGATLTPSSNDIPQIHSYTGKFNIEVCVAN